MLWFWGGKLDTMCWVINLEKNGSRLRSFMYNYQNSDISYLPLHRLSAIYGRDLDVKKYITDGAYRNLLINERQGYRTRHYQLTRGAIGCYLSHMEIYKKLVNDDRYNYYLIFEDDGKILPNVNTAIGEAIADAPDDWDIIVFGPIINFVTAESKHLRKFKYFWGLIGYAISKRGAKKFLDDHDKINMQIDSKMTYMAIDNKFNIYGTKKITVMNDRSQGTDIQMVVKSASNPYMLELI
jgi:GR25 family glycosyltransferase involved in LPS biosynthesis